MTAASPDRRAIITEALRKIDDLTSRLEKAENAETEPIAVVGIGCRLPGGVHGVDDFWKFLSEGGNGVIRVPEDRWDADELYSPDHSAPGTICNREGGFLTSWQPDEFDAEFFSIAPREAAAMDPQQRLLLEVAWEALEHAAINPRALRGSATGVYVGMTTNDYYHSVVSKLNLEDIDAYVPFGNAPNFAAGRLSYFLGVRGPAVVSDTACSSSLVSIHLACQSLRRRESDQALAAGVNLILSPENNIACSRGGMLSPEGRCKTFDADADGYVRSEGCGVVVLKRLSDAVRDDDQIWAVIRGSAVNQDGASSGQTVPNGLAQQELMRKALETSQLRPSDIDYVEAHGTGTALGDPIELDALTAVYGERGESSPLILGSVKTNLGHLESAAGVTGFIKTVLSVHHAHIPRQLHFNELTPRAGAAAAKFTIASQPCAWPAVDRPRRAAVSSFGVSGTNAHIIIEQNPHHDAGEQLPEPAVSSLVLSGKSPARIATLAGRLADWMETPMSATASLADIANSLNHHRAQLGKFATVTAADRDQAIAGLRAVAGKYPAPGVTEVHEGACTPGKVFVYSGQGSQWAGMARRLLTDEPAFGKALAEIEPVFVDRVGFSLQQIIAGGVAISGDSQVQPVLMGLQLALTELWRSYDVIPDAVVGHSMGEVTAAVVAGALTLSDGLDVITHRSSIMGRLAGQGAVALLNLDSTAVTEALESYSSLQIAGYLSPRQTVVAGTPDEVDAIIAASAARDIFARRVNMEVASHTDLMDPILADLHEAFGGISPSTPTIPFLSTVVEGESEPVLGADYWVANVRKPVRFSQVILAAADRYGMFIEISPHAILTQAVSDTLSGRHHHSIATLRRDTHDTVSFHTNLNASHTVRPPSTPRRPGPRVSLPPTPWHHGHHWIRPTPSPESADRTAARDDPGETAGAQHEWFHTLSWPVRELAPTQSDGTWLVLADYGNTELARQLDNGSRALPISVLDRNIDQLQSELGDVDHVVFAPTAPEDRLDATAAFDVFGKMRRLVVALAGLPAAARTPRIFVVTRNALPIEVGDRANPVHAILWGQGRTLALENPELWGGLIDVDDTLPTELLAKILQNEASVTRVDRDDQAVYRAGERRVARLEPHRLPAVTQARLGADTSHLVIGATGNVGPYLIRQLADMGASTVVAVSRRGGGSLDVEEIEGGTTVVHVAADAADENAMSALFARFGRDLPQLEGIYIASLAGGEALLTEMTDDDVRPMFRSKVEAVSLLHKLSLATPVRRFVLFSSIAGLLGSRAVAHYTAANTFADSFAYARAALGLPATVVDWGLWKSWSDAQPQMKAAGLEPMPNDIAIRMLPAVLNPDARTQTVVAGADWPRLAEAYRMRAPVKVLDHLLSGPSGGGLDALPPPNYGTVLGERVEGTRHENLWQARLAPDELPYDVAHLVHGANVVPASVVAHTLWRTAASLGSAAIGDVRFEYPIFADQPKAVYVVRDGGKLSVWSSPGTDLPEHRWTRHAEARLTTAPEVTGRPSPGTPERTIDDDAVAEMQRKSGVEGQPFEWVIGDCAVTADGVFANVTLPDPDTQTAQAALLDLGLQIARLADADNEQLLVPSAARSIVLGGGSAASSVHVEVHRHAGERTALVTDVLMTASDGVVWLDVRGLTYSPMESAPAPTAGTDKSAAAEFIDWSALSAQRTVAELRVRLRSILSRELGMPEEAIDIDQPFPELGLDSMMAMNLLRDAKALVRVELSATMLWNHPSISLLSDFVSELLAPQRLTADSEPADNEPTQDSSDEFSVLDELFESIESSVESANAGSEGAI